MIDRKAVIQMLEEHLLDSPLFLIDVLVKPGNILLVFLDSDQEVTIDDCARISRFIESRLNRDTEDYELRVSSAGIDHPYQSLRQYIKNQGRQVQVSLTDGTLITGMLIRASEQCIEIRPFKPGRKKKAEEEAVQQIPFDQIRETKGVITFK